eukprot:TRINITY_DN14506_c0_g1_i1.p1 TRINITY_DN14506_c0_g1~~TRINITY_DN14506_c0_g1_i1.p1  ORF type:complete len:302 (+),score=71.50 TRINITY_DN14506_c0_g1_i1:62-967(+)
MLTTPAAPRPPQNGGQPPRPPRNDGPQPVRTDVLRTPLPADAAGVPGDADAAPPAPFAPFNPYVAPEQQMWPYDWRSAPRSSAANSPSPLPLPRAPPATMGFDPQWLRRHESERSARMEVFQMAASPARSRPDRREGPEEDRPVRSVRPWLGSLPPTLRERCNVRAQRAAGQRAVERRRRDMQIMQHAVRLPPFPSPPPRQPGGSTQWPGNHRGGMVKSRRVRMKPLTGTVPPPQLGQDGFGSAKARSPRGGQRSPRGQRSPSLRRRLEPLVGRQPNAPPLPAMAVDQRPAAVDRHPAAAG